MGKIQITMLGITLVMFCALHSSVSTYTNPFTFADTNNDGYMSVAEIAALFGALDADGNGEVSRAELTGAVCAWIPSLYTWSHYMFDFADTDSNGILDSTDYSNLHDQMDTNNDGQVSFIECIAYWPPKIADAYDGESPHPQEGSCP